MRIGLLHVHILHTSASLTINENASPDVRRDFETWFNQAVPEDFAGWTHTLEGRDDMPAHVKASLLGPSLTLPVGEGRPRARHLAGRSTCASTATTAARARSSPRLGRVVARNSRMSSGTARSGGVSQPLERVPTASVRRARSRGSSARAGRELTIRSRRRSRNSSPTPSSAP